MYHFFIKKTDIADGRLNITGADRHHAVDVLRLARDEELMVSDEEGRDYRCRVIASDQERLELSILEELTENHELPADIWLFQGLPKSDKLELIIQKATELGVSHVVPMITKNTVAKPDEKKLPQKLKRWRAIAESAANQSKRSKLPIIEEPMRFTDAVKLAERLDLSVIPDEREEAMDGLCEAIIGFMPGRSIGVFIGPEGGFDRLELEFAEKRSVLPVSLGKRILRTETAAIAMLSLVMIRIEIAESMQEEQ